MTEYELLRIITFLERVKGPYRELVPIAEEDASWNILLYLIKQNLTGSVVTISSLASIAKIPFATANRRIHDLIEAGHILKKAASDTGRSFVLVPSPQLSSSFIQYAKRIKSLLAETFGMRPKLEDEDSYYFGGSYFAAQIIPPPQLIDSLFRGKRELKFLLNDDNYFASMRNMWSDFRNNMSSRRNFDLLKLPDLHARIIENAGRQNSTYDIIAFNAPWAGEVANKGIFRSLNALIEGSSISPHDFHPSVWSMGSW